MKAAYVPVLATFAGLAFATKGSPNAIFKRGEPECGTGEGKEVPADNKCDELLEYLDSEDPIEVTAGEPEVVGCADTCQVSVTVEDDSSELKHSDIREDVQAIIDSCGGDGAFKGELSAEGRTSTVSISTDCGNLASGPD